MMAKQVRLLCANLFWHPKSGSVTAAEYLEQPFRDLENKLAAELNLHKMAFLGAGFRSLSILSFMAKWWMNAGGVIRCLLLPDQW